MQNCSGKGSSGDYRRVGELHEILNELSNAACQFQHLVLGSLLPNAEL